jgi:hypothetical protein
MPGAEAPGSTGLRHLTNSAMWHATPSMANARRGGHDAGYAKSFRVVELRLGLIRRARSISSIV